MTAEEKKELWRLWSEKLREKFPSLTESDVARGAEDDEGTFEHLQRRLSLSRGELQDIFESLLD